MKSGRYFFILIFILCGLSCFAQQAKVNITGTVVEETTNEPIELATVRLLNVKDSSMVGGVTTSHTGSFILKNIKTGNYLLNVTFVGFNPLFKPVRVTGKTNPLKLGRLTLNEGIELAEAVVIGKAPEVIVRNDTMEYNADSYKVAEGSMLEDLLKKMPGVEVDSEGKVTVNGKEIKKVLIDGKEFFSDDPKVASKNLPSKMIEKVQVLDKKSDMAMMTGFDDGEEETVINLTVKPGMKQGWFGNAFAGYGSKDRYEGNAMLNRFLNNDQFTLMGGLNNTNNMGFSDLASTMFSGMGGGGRRGFGRGGAGNGITSSGNAGLNFSKEFNKKLVLGGNIRYSHSDNDAWSKSKQENILTGDSSTFYNERNQSNTKNDNIGADFRMEWKPDSLTNIIFRPSFSYSSSHNYENGSFETLTPENDTINTGISNNFSDGAGYNVNARLDFSRKLNDRGRVFSFSLSGGASDSYNKGMSYSETNYYLLDKDSILDQRFRYDNTGYNYRAYLSWVEPIGHNNFIQATYSFSQNRQESLKKTYAWEEEEQDYTRLDTAYSKSYRNNFINQRVSLSFKAQREKYNYTIGMNLDPSYTSSENFVADSVLSKWSRNVVNISPMAQFNYLFDKRTNLRIRYNGRTSQPSMTQLQPVADVSDPLNTIIGNPDLNPKYTNNLFIRFQKFTPEKQRAFIIMANGNYIVNDIVSYSVYEKGSGKKITTYKNVNGNYNANLRVMLNTPLRNKRFTINTMTMASFDNSNGFINEEKNTSKNLVLSERAGIDFRSDYIDIGLNGNIRYNGTSNSLQKQNNQNVFNYGVGGTTTLYLPLDFKVESDITYSTNSGYTNGFEQNEVLWNAAASKSFLKNNQATLRLKVYDILHQRSNISRTVTATAITDTEYNTLSSYFMVHFIYRFSIFKGGATASDAMGGRWGPMGGHRRF